LVNIGNEWDVLLSDEFEKPYYQQLRQFLRREYASQTIYPAMDNIFNALRYTTYSSVRCVILGQDPYHGEGQAHGLSFSVQRGVQVPPSLRNIYQEIYQDTGIDNRQSCGELIPWTQQGVLLLNTVLTVRANQPQSHRNQGWEIFTDQIIRLLNVREDPIVFLLWGAPAGKKAALITNPCHLVLKAPHPSPLSASRGFFGCRHFSQTNQYLQAHGFAPIDWTIR
jgi:uracil-DNA glycosylase